MKIWLGLMGLALVVCGCSHTQAPPAASPVNVTGPAAKPGAPIITIDTSLQGKVVFFNPGSRYVVVAFPIGHLPAMDQRMSVYREGVKVGEVKITGPQIDDKVAADISTGEAAKGDTVREQ